jgi:hypothetical protein
MPNPTEDIQSESGPGGNRICVTLHPSFLIHYSPLVYTDFESAAEGTALKKSDLVSKSTWQAIAAGRKVSLQKFFEAADAVALHFAKKHRKAVTYGMLAEPLHVIGEGLRSERAGGQYIADLKSLELIDAPWYCPAEIKPESKPNEHNEGGTSDDTKPTQPERPDVESHIRSNRLSCQLVCVNILPLILLIGLIAAGLLSNSTDGEVTALVNVFVERSDSARLVGLHESGALPICAGDKFNIDVQISPAAYVYVIWIDPGRDITPVFPWDPKIGWGSRPQSENTLSQTLTLPMGTNQRYEAPETKAGVATIVMFATGSPLRLTDDQLSDIFSNLPELPLRDNEESGVVWFENYREVRDPNRVRTFNVVQSGDPFALWQGQLKERLGNQVTYQCSVSFARQGHSR